MTGAFCVLIADRGEMACRVARTLRRQGLSSAGVFSSDERFLRHALSVDRALAIGPPPAERTHRNAGAILDAARIVEARAVHPGRGPLAESAAFAALVEEAGLWFLGPSPEELRMLALPAELERIAHAADLPLRPRRPLFLGRSGAERKKTSRRLAVPIFGDGRGRVVSLGIQDASARRGSREILREHPAPDLSRVVAARIEKAAVTLGEALGHRAFACVELALDVETEALELLAVRAHLDTLDAVTEEALGIDLVSWMIELARGTPLDLAARGSRRHAIAARIEAVDPERQNQPSSGLLLKATFPEKVRIETGYQTGDRIGEQGRDRSLAVVCASGRGRASALRSLTAALEGTELGGLPTTLSLVQSLVSDPRVQVGGATEGAFTDLAAEPSSLRVLEPGLFSIVVDHPGRLGYWHVGVPPSGPMDDLSLRLANRIVGNPEGAAGLELTLQGPTLKFAANALVALTGAELPARLDGEPVERYRPIPIRAGQTLSISRLSSAGLRAYLAVRGGLDVPSYLGSRTTFTLGGFGGHGGRTLQRGDVLPIGKGRDLEEPKVLAPELWPAIEAHVSVGVLYGPHGAPDFFTPQDIQTLFSTEWEVHHHSSRTGVRLIGPKPEWARPDGGEAGLHPSNIHDVAYAVGTIDFTGDMPILLGPDGPSLGGFVCPATVVRAELHKLGQLAPGTRVRFVPLSEKRAAELFEAQEALVDRLEPPASTPRLEAVAPERAVVAEHPGTSPETQVVYRRSGDSYLLVEYGPPVLDLGLRLRAHALMTHLKESRLPGILDLTPGIRSLQIHFDPERLSGKRLLRALERAEADLRPAAELELPARIVHLPLSFNDPQARLAVEKYARSVRPDAPWCPSNLEFIRRINGLDSIDQVRSIVFDASYLVLGLGDVYLGAPVATPVDPRHRLVTTKYNPARTWTPENAVGIGGAYLCIYGMEGPGGYQLVGRTLQVFNRFRWTGPFSEEPWLLRFFDQIRFYPVEADQLLEMREAFIHGKLEIRIEECSFVPADHERFQKENAASIAAFKRRQQAAFEAEKNRWIAAGQLGTRAPRPLAASPEAP